MLFLLPSSFALSPSLGLEMFLLELRTSLLLTLAVSHAVFCLTLSSLDPANKGLTVKFSSTRSMEIRNEVSFQLEGLRPAQLCALPAQGSIVVVGSAEELQCLDLTSRTLLNTTSKTRTLTSVSSSIIHYAKSIRGCSIVFVIL